MDDQVAQVIGVCGWSHRLVAVTDWIDVDVALRWSGRALLLLLMMIHILAPPAPALLLMVMVLILVLLLLLLLPLLLLQTPWLQGGALGGPTATPCCWCLGTMARPLEETMGVAAGRRQIASC
jgi:hypothetical protein